MIKGLLGGFFIVRGVPLEPAARVLCKRPYPGHPKGCPNYGKRADCPPKRPDLGEILDLRQNVWCVYNCFPLAAHISRMLEAHPGWSWAQLACCLYWQGTARKALRARMAQFLASNKSLVAVYTPEATGVNVTELMRQAGIVLEWPPRTVAVQVALAGTPR